MTPRHIGIIMDGNGRWAYSKGLNRQEGHRQGTKNLNDVLSTFKACGVETVTLYAFSTENWNRPNEEVANIFDLLIESVTSDLKELKNNNIRIQHIGKKTDLPTNVIRAISKAENSTSSNTGLHLIIAFNYGGRAEIVDAVKQIILDDLGPEEINEESIENRLYTAGISSPDLIIRTAGEKRTSNFLMWQSAYSEYYFTDVLWPDFSKADAQAAVEEYQARNRRFGALGN
jgi:undecaprenyl diphosphate synthase